MQLRMWMYDLAREQAPAYEHLRRFLETARQGGYNAMGLYLEHRFAYPSAPWAAGQGAVTPDMVRALGEEYADVQIIPFVNLLGHFEGMIYTEEGKRYREERFKGMQACPSNPQFVAFAEKLLADVLEAFDSEIVHIGGDETWQLGACERCAQRVADAASSGEDTDGKAVLYGEHFGRLAEKVVQAGRRPAVWGDMFLEHPQALAYMPKQSLIFDWQYFESPYETSKRFVDEGFEVVCCPTLQAYNAMWLHLPQSLQNVRDAADAAGKLGALGVCVTTWESGLFGNYETLLPVIEQAGSLLTSPGGERGPGADGFSLREQLQEEVQPSAAGTDVNFVVFDLRGELSGSSPEEVHKEEEISIAWAVMQSLVKQALQARVSAFELRRTEATTQIYWTSPYERMIGELEEAIGDMLVRKLRMYCGIPAYPRNIPGKGTLSGTFNGSRFEFEAESWLGPDGLEISFRNMSGTTGQDLTTQAPRDESGPGDVEFSRWAHIMGEQLQEAGGPFAHSRTRSSLKVRLLLNANPFLAWLYHADELTGECGDRALEILDRAVHIAPDSATRGVSEFAKMAIEFVRFADQARQAYAQGLPGVAVASLAPCRQIFENLERIAQATHLNIGGSLADVYRCRAAKEHVERVIKRIRDYGDGSLGYLPAFEHLTHPKFVPHDQAAWWLINRWANE